MRTCFAGADDRFTRPAIDSFTLKHSGQEAFAMNNLYLITTAIEQSDSPYPILNGRFCITTTTELEAAAIALANQPDHAFIFSVEVYLSPRYLHALHSDRSALLLHSGSLCRSTGRKRKRHFYKQKSNE